ncbi:MAG: TspO/MBR family protein [Sedimentisphaerales bacterium]
MKRDEVVKLIICCSVPLAVGFAGSLFTANSMDWYQTLAKPAFNLPSWVFAPVWTSLYLLMGISAFLVWRKEPADTAVKVALACFILQLVFNALWTPIFFGAKQPLIAFGDIILLWLAIASTIICFYRVYKLSAILLVPYILWVSFAAVLNAAICMLN